jgi:DASH complex subunit Hsk3 like
MSTNQQSSHNRPSSAASANASISSSNKNRQYAHLHAQLAQLNAHLADTENLVRMTAVQAQDMRFLGGYVGGLFMGSARVLGEESVDGRNGGEDGGTQKEG